MAVKDLNSKIETLTSKNKSNWENKAKDRKANRSWLKHSRKIAIEINSFLKSNNIKQKELAELLDVSPQQVSKIIKGRENLTLETISKIEDVLVIKILEYRKNQESQKTELSLHKDFDYTRSSFQTDNYQISSPKIIKVDFRNTRRSNKIAL